MTFRGRSKSGFTMVEILIICSIIAVLVALLLIYAFNSIEKTRMVSDASIESNAKSIGRSEVMMSSTFGGKPLSEKATEPYVAVYNKSLGKWVSDKTAVTPYGKCKDHKDMYVMGRATFDPSANTYAISICWTDGTGKEYPLDMNKTDEKGGESFASAPSGEHSLWEYTLDKPRSMIYLEKYIGTGVDPIVYGAYVIDGKMFNTSLGSDGGLFAGRVDIVSVSFSNAVDSSSVKSFASMFEGCTSLKKIDMGGLTGESAVNLSRMFYDCTALKEIDLSSFSTPVATDMSGMFGNCVSLSKALVGGLVTAKVVNMDDMFLMCASLKNIDLSSFDTSSVRVASYMFSGCSGLKKLDLASFNFEKCVDVRGMFSGCTSLKKIIVGSSWLPSSGVSDEGMMSGCPAVIETA